MRILFPSKITGNGYMNKTSDTIFMGNNEY